MVQKITSDSSFWKKNNHWSRVNWIQWTILSGLKFQVTWNMEESKQSMIYVEKSKKSDQENWHVSYTGSNWCFPSTRVYSVEKHDGELIINEYSWFLKRCVVALKILYPYFIRLFSLEIRKLVFLKCRKTFVTLGRTQINRWGTLLCITKKKRFYS